MDRHALNTTKHCALESHKHHKNLRRYLNKSYTFVRNERYGELLRKLGTEKTAESKALTSRPTVMLREQNGEYIWKTVYPELKRTFFMKFRINEPAEQQLSNGIRVVTRFEIHKNDLIETQNFDDGRTITVTRQFDDNQLVLIIEVNNIQSFRFYVAGSSQHTICTETSRRQSFVEKLDDLRKNSSRSLLSFETSEGPENETTDSEEICL